MATNPLPVPRNIPARVTPRGGVEWRSQMTRPNNSVAVVNMISDRLIPIVFVPGVMGSNLRGIGAAKGVDWILDSSLSMIWWLNRDEDERNDFLRANMMEVFNGGKLPEGTQLPAAEMKRRGWGEVGALSYTEFLAWMENAFSDVDDPHRGVRHSLIGKALGAAKGEAALIKEDVGLSYKYGFPVHACGYNWLGCNSVSAKRLKNRINAIIKYYKDRRFKCENVILVTHSMGGLVARYCTENLEMSKIVMGVVHGVMPAIGAAAVYRRMQAGTEGGGASARVLGEDAGEMTTVMARAAGPLELLPTPQYGNGWLRIKEKLGGKYYESKLPKEGNPYKEIYLVRDKWWSMVCDRLINPDLDDGDADYKQKLDAEWTKYVTLVNSLVLPFHQAIADRYHCNTYAFYGSSPSHRAYGNVTWTGEDDMELLPRGDRHADFMNGKRTAWSEIGTKRTVESQLLGKGKALGSWKSSIEQVYTISEPEEEGDGTVPDRSGVAPLKNGSVKAMLKLVAEHEPAYRESMVARHFTVRSILQIAREVEKTSLAYK